MPAIWAEISDKLLGFQGRLNRRDWWIFSAGLLGLGLALYQLLGFVGIYTVLEWMNPTGELDSEWENGVIWLFIGGFLLWPNLALSVKRAHDIGVSGWIAVAVIYFAQYNGDLMMPLFNLDTSHHWILDWLYLGSNLAFVGLLGCMPGQKIANRYGAVPQTRTPEKIAA